MFLYNNKLKQTARKLRTNATIAETILWRYIRRKQIYGIQFYRQKIIGNYIVDFFAPSINLIIEVDGTYHNILEQRYQDQERDAYLSSLGIIVLRITNQKIITSITTSIQKIKNTILRLRTPSY